MHTREQRHLPGSVHACNLARGSVLVVLDGRLRITYRDETLHWLMAAPPAVSVVLDEGECHVLPYDVRADLSAVGPRAARSAISVRPGPRRRLAPLTQALEWLRARGSAAPPATGAPDRAGRGRRDIRRHGV